MRRSWISILLAVILNLALALPAAAGISVIADLDSNATNGPDTLVIEPTDTVLVYLWFTGSDSIGSFGLTLGDTSGALSWVEESAASVYNTPNGWANVPVQQDSLGWLLLQATDFSFQVPIQVPYEFARLKFSITTGDSCGTVGGNFDRSGWFNQDLGEGSFTSFEGLTICVDSVLDGGGDGGEGGEDDEAAGGGEGGGLDGGGGECDSLPCCEYVEDKPETGRVWVVNDSGTVGVDCDCIYIQACIDSADSGDTVCVNPGTYDDLWQVPYEWLELTRSHATSRATFAILKSDIVVRSSAGPDFTFVGVEDQQTPHVCVIISDPTEEQNSPIENVVVEGFTFQYGYTNNYGWGDAYGAGSMLVNRGLSSVVVRENVFQDNRGAHGGAIRSYAEPTIQDNVFRRNKVRGCNNCQGGAIQVTGGRNPTHPRPRIEGNLFEDNGLDPLAPGWFKGGVLSLEDAGAFFIDNQLRRNNAGRGGAIYVLPDCDPVIKFNVVEQCTASTAGGGAIWSTTTDTLEICGNTFRENVSLNGNGGALKLKGTNGIIRRNRFIRNSAVEGGAIFLSDNAMPLIEKNFFDACSADSMGGAIAVDTTSGADSVRIRANTFVDNNVADGKGGAVALRSAITILDDNFFLRSLAEEGGALSLFHGSTALVEHNVFDSCMASVSGAAIAVGSEEMTGTMRVRNNTFVCNVAPNNKGAALYTAAPSFVMSFMRNIVAFSESSGVVLDHADASVDSFGCNDFYENSGLDYIGIGKEEITDTLFSADPKLCEGNSCSLYTLDITSMCAPGSVCAELIGARGTCNDCSVISSLCEYAISTGIVAADRPTLSPEVPGLIARPNPFNSTVRIFFYNQGSRGRVRITIYDVQGRMVYQFPEEWAPEGWMSRVWRGNNWEGSAVASGVYFAQIRDRESQRTCKILLVR